MNNSDNSSDLLKAFLERLAAKEGIDVHAAATNLTTHEWGEVAERAMFYPALRETLVADPVDASTVLECVKTEGKTILGGHAVFRTRVKDFLESDVANDALKKLIDHGEQPPSLKTIDEFIQSVVAHGFHNKQGKPMRAGAAYFTSVLLGMPKKVDIDKMHSYRDAIRDSSLRRAVRYAAILYPGAEKRYTDDIEALQAYPGHAEKLKARLTEVLTTALADPIPGATK